MGTTATGLPRSSGGPLLHRSKVGVEVDEEPVQAGGHRLVTNVRDIPQRVRDTFPLGGMELFGI